MTVRLITQALLTNSHFLEATEQAGPYWGQPVPYHLNAGSLKPIIVGSAYTWVYSGSVTETGSHTAIRDAVLAETLGDGWAVAGKVTLYGAASGTDPQDVTSTGMANGELIWANSVTNVNSGDEFLLQLNYKDRDFLVEILDSGDVGGEGTFKWSHDGGTTYLCRDDPEQADYLGATMVQSVVWNVNSQTCVIGQAANGDILQLSHRSLGHVYGRTSYDGGITWSVPTSKISGAHPVHTMLTNRAGRMIAYGGLGAGSSYMYYSDNHGVGWSTQRWLSRDLNEVIQLADGRYGAVYEYGDDIYYITSDDGFTWAFDGTEVDAGPVGLPTNVRPSVVQCENGDLIVAWETDRDAYTNFEIKYRISDDGGTTWSSRSDIFTFTTTDYMHPRLVKDVNGDIYCLATLAASPNKIVAKKSTDNGDSWGSEFDVISNGSDDLTLPYPTLIDGHMLMVNYRNNTDKTSYVCRRGMWETIDVASNAPCALYPTEQAGRMHLVAGAHLAWLGSAGIDGDFWTFEAQYTYGMKNFTEDAPSRPWRSLQDNIDCEIVMSLGDDYVFPIDAIALFNTNIRYCLLQTANTSVWIDTYLFDNEVICTDMIAGNAISNHSNNEVQANSYIEKPHQYQNSFLQWRSGNDLGIINKVEDNDMRGLYVNENTSNDWTADDPFVLSSKSVVKRLQSNQDEFNVIDTKFLRIFIPAQQTYEGYYEIGNIIMGLAIDCGYPQVGYPVDHAYGVELIRNVAGGIYPLKRYGRKRTWELTWPNNDNYVSRVLQLIDFAEGAENLIYVPDDTDTMDIDWSDDNKIQNANFTTLSYWEAGNNATLTNPASGHYTANACLITENDYDNPQLKQIVTVEPSKTHILNWHSKAEGGNLHHVKVWEEVRSVYLDDGLQVNSDYGGDWARHAFPFTVPFDVNTVTLIWEITADSGSGDSMYVNGLVHCVEAGRTNACYLTKLAGGGNPTAEQEHVFMDRYNLTITLEEVL